MRSVQDTFKLLNETVHESAMYAVLLGWHGMPTALQDKCMILCNNVEQFVRITGLAAPAGDLGRIPKFRLLQGSSCEFHLIQKGSGLFSEPFESQVLARRILYNGVYVPDMQNQSIILTAFAVRQNLKVLETPEAKYVMEKYLSQQVGVGRGLKTYVMSM